MTRWRKSRSDWTTVSFSRRKGKKQMNELPAQSITIQQQKTAKTSVLWFWGYGKCSSNEEFFNHIMKPDQIPPSLCSFTWFANLQQQNWWQLNRMEFISGLEIVLAAYGFPAEWLQITPHLCEVAEFCHLTIPPVQSTSRELHRCHLTAICPGPGTFLQCSHPQINKRFCLPEGFQDLLPRQVGWPVCSTS